MVDLFIHCMTNISHHCIICPQSICMFYLQSNFFYFFLFYWKEVSFSTYSALCLIRTCGGTTDGVEIGSYKKELVGFRLNCGIKRDEH